MHVVAFNNWREFQYDWVSSKCPNQICLFMGQNKLLLTILCFFCQRQFVLLLFNTFFDILLLISPCPSTAQNSVANRKTKKHEIVHEHRIKARFASFLNGNLSQKPDKKSPVRCRRSPYSDWSCYTCSHGQLLRPTRSCLRVTPDKSQE